MTDTTVASPPETLVARYAEDDLEVFDDEERIRFAPLELERLAWEVLYRKEPQLFARLIRGERIHPDVLRWLPHASRAVEVGAGTGRLTRALAEHCDELVAIEPAAPLRAFLEGKFGPHVDVRRGFFDALPVHDDWADLTISCSALTADPAHGGDAGLQEMERVTAPGGLVIVVWSSDVEWLRSRGFTYESFPGDMTVDFGTLEEAIELATIFYPGATDEIARRGTAEVPYDVLGMNAPRDLAWKKIG